MNDAGIGPWRWLGSLREAEQVLGWSLPEWERAIRLARRLRLLGRMAESVDAAGLLGRVPPQAARHLLGEGRKARFRTRSLVWAAERVGQALADAPYPRVLLKGAAYIAQGLPIGRGRLPSDLDILVPRDAIADAQRRLVAAGWREPTLDEHDSRYYHAWSHEVPPMRHREHGLELDLHHNIQPPVARLKVDAALLLAAARPIEHADWRGWQVLDPLDQILHSATHLFQDADLTERVRDLADLDALLRAGAASAPRFWALLLARARDTGLGSPLALALQLLPRWFGTPVPADVAQGVARQGPGRLQSAWLLPALRTVLTPVEPDSEPPWTRRLAGAALGTRYHLTRMPLPLLAAHAWHKLRHRSNAAKTWDDAPRPMKVGEAPARPRKA
ncbi:MAG: nucleotidyltransferase family protein [Rubrivivax sp.]